MSAASPDVFILQDILNVAAAGFLSTSERVREIGFLGNPVPESAEKWVKSNLNKAFQSVPQSLRRAPL